MFVEANVVFHEGFEIVPVLQHVANNISSKTRKKYFIDFKTITS